MEIRCCTRCDQEYPLDAVYWAWNTDDKGYSKICVACHEQARQEFLDFLQDSDIAAHRHELKSLKPKPTIYQLNKMLKRFESIFFGDEGSDES